MKYIVTTVLSFFIVLFSFAQINIKSKPKVALNHTAINVLNLQASKNFYQQIIGLDTIPEPFHDGKHVWFKTGIGTALHIIEGAKEKKIYFWENHTCFSVSSFDEFISQLKNNNVVWQNVQQEKYKTTTRPDGVHQIWFQDPDGYWIEANDAKY
jgi:lactoylglutathione lyase